MPPAVKRGIAQTILMLMGGTFLTGMVSWMGVELIQSHDNNIKSAHVSEAVDEIVADNKEAKAYQVVMMGIILNNQTEIKLLRSDLGHCVDDVEENSDAVKACQTYRNSKLTKQ